MGLKSDRPVRAVSTSRYDDACPVTTFRAAVPGTDITQWEAIGRAHGEVFRDIRPATAMVQVAKLIDPDMQVEIEADAYVGH
jgi:enamine deaminase RidA (YjgF/YER057c/UK114 family)